MNDAIMAPMADFGGLRLDLLRRKATVGPTTLALTPRELALLYALLQADGGAVSREALCAAGDLHMDDRSLHNHIHRLRKKLIDLGYLISPVRKLGYRLTRA